jgi:hypothetical protein
LLVYFFGVLTEFRGLDDGGWNYSSVSSILKVSGIPVEILIGYFTGALLIVILIFTLYDLSNEKIRIGILKYFLLVIGIIFLIYTLINNSISMVVPWAFLGTFGIIISQRKSIPIFIGLLAFFADWLVEGGLTNDSEYYAKNWDPLIGIVFMFVCMFIGGIITSRKCMPGTLFCFYEYDEKRIKIQNES